MTYFNKRPKTNKQTKSNIETCLNARDEKMHCTFDFIGIDMKWTNNGYCRFSVKAMAVGVVTKPVPQNICS